MSASTYGFAGVELDSSSRSLRAGDQRVEITPLVFKTLAFLAKNSDRIVSKDELAKVDEIVSMLRNQAATSGGGLDPDAESTIREAVRSIIESSDSRKQRAVDQLKEGDSSAAAARIEEVAVDLAAASEQSLVAAAESWSEAGAIYYTSNIDEAVRCYEEAFRLRPNHANFAADLGYAYIRAGRLDDAVDVFGNGLNLQPSNAVLINTLRGLGTAARLQAEYGVAATHLDRAMSLARKEGDLRQQGLLLLQMGSIATSQGDLDLARRNYETVIERAEEIGDDHLLSRALNSFGIVMARTDNYEAANEAFSRAYEIDLARNDLAGQAQSIGNLGASALRSGDADAAAQQLARSVEIGRQLGDHRSVALDLTNLATIAASQDDFALAEARLDEALGIAVRHNYEDLRLIIIVNQGEIARDSGDIDEACRLWLEALPQLEAIEHGAAPIVQGYVEDSGCSASTESI
jgi:tetratricopeptide (TPR) repeat protein